MSRIKLRSKRALTLLCGVLIALLLLAGPALSAFGAPDGEPLRVGVPEDRCPIFYRDAETGEPTGIGVDLMRVAAAEAGYQASFAFLEEKTLKEALDNPAYDLVLPFGSAVLSGTGRLSIVSENLMQTPFTLVTTGGQVLPPLNELRVGMLRSLAGSAETVQQLYPGMEITLYDSMDESVRSLRDGRADALLHNSYVWSYVLQKPAYADLSVQPSTMFSMDFRAGTLDTDRGRATIERLNAGIAALSDTRRQAVILDYTSRRLYRYTWSDYCYQYGLVFLLGGLLFAAVIVIAILAVRAVRKEQEEKMRHLLDHDALTDLLNIDAFRRRVEELLLKHPGTPYFLSYNNIRDFKYINDSLGRAAGNELLRFWAAKSMAVLSDDEAIGRITSDRFAVLRRIDNEEKMGEDVRSVFEPVQNFFLDRGKGVRVQISSGIYVLTPEDFRQIDVDHMLDLARLAEKQAREERKADFTFYNPEQWEQGKRIADIINLLPAALQAGDIQVWYQPQVNYETGAVTGAEALCRWDHTRLGWLHPSAFIETLEEAGLIYELDSFVWERVCQDLQRWNAQGRRRSVSVNVSRLDFREDRDLPEQFRRLTETYGLTPDQLHVEITESAYAENPESLIAATEKLRALGFTVEMDDFGSGYSSLHMLKEVPVDRIKLDLHFLTESGDPEKCRTIVSCIIRMVQALRMELIAEGVETIEQARFLKSQGCCAMQGYYFYKPLSPQRFEQMMAERD